jgi:hypothetical protein
MTLAQQKQRLMVILFVLAIVLVLLLSFATFEIVQYMNGMWQTIHGVTGITPDIMSGNH